MKHLISILITVHGAIHLLGFLKAYGLMKTSAMTQNIGGIAGIFWLLSFLLFILSVMLFYYGQPLWPFVLLTAILISQILIIGSWNDAKYGTILNLLFLLIALSKVGSINFDIMVEKEVAYILSQPSKKVGPDTASVSLDKIPPVVQKWLRNSGALNKPPVERVFLKQKGLLKTSSSGHWMPFTASQWFNITPPSFIWKSDVSMWGPLYFLGRDKLSDGKGSMLIKLNGLLPVVNVENDLKTDEATMQRFMAEMCWFPTAALQSYLHWKYMDEHTAKVTMTLDDKTVTGQFTFSPKGDPIMFETRRYMGQGKNARQEVWQVLNTSFRTFNGIRIPDKSEVRWKLAEGDFHWLQLEISELLYNDDFTYQAK